MRAPKPKYFTSHRPRGGVEVPRWSTAAKPLICATITYQAPACDTVRKVQVYRTADSMLAKPRFTSHQTLIF